MKAPASEPELEVCRNLRWKGHDEELDGVEVAQVAMRNTVPYHCLRTCQPWGVDDGPAVPELCVEGRACFAARRVAAGG
jgi:hypothetical protein